MVDGQSTFLDCIKRCFDLYNGTAKPIEREISTDDQGTDTEGTEKEPKNASTPATVASSAQEPTTAPSSKKDNNNNNFNQTHIDMKNYPLISAACEIKEGEIEVNAEGAFMNVPLLDSIEAKLNTNEQAVADAKQKATTAEQKLADLQAKYDALQKDLDAAKTLADETAATLAKKDEELTTLTAKKDEEIAALTTKKDEEIASLTTDKAKVEEELKGAKESLATAEQTIVDKDAQIAALTEEAGKEPAAGTAPGNNGEGAQVTEPHTAYPTWNPSDPVGSKKAIEKYKRDNGLL